MDDPHFFVVEFLFENPWKDQQYYCVEKSWIAERTLRNRTVPANIGDAVRVLYPYDMVKSTEWHLKTGNTTDILQRMGTGRILLGLAKYRAATCEDALNWISENTISSTDASKQKSSIYLSEPKSKVINTETRSPNKRTRTDSHDEVVAKRSTLPPSRSRCESTDNDAINTSKDSDIDRDNIAATISDLVNEVGRRGKLLEQLLPEINDLRTLCIDNNILFEVNINTSVDRLDEIVRSSNYDHDKDN